MERVSCLIRHQTSSTTTKVEFFFFKLRENLKRKKKAETFVYITQIFDIISDPTVYSFLSIVEKKWNWIFISNTSNLTLTTWPLVFVWFLLLFLTIISSPTHTKKRKKQIRFFYFQNFFFLISCPPPPQFLNVVQIVCPLWLLQLLSLLIISRQENYIEITLSHGSENMRQFQGNQVGLRFETKKKNLGGKKKKINHSISRKSVIIITFIHKNTHKKVYQLG